MNEREVIEVLEACEADGEDHEALNIAIEALEMQIKLKAWIAGYKNREYFMIDRDELISILEKFTVEE